MIDVVILRWLLGHSKCVYVTCFYYVRCIMMRAEEFSKNILDLDDKMRFAGIMEKSGHLHARCKKEGCEEYLKVKNQGISFSQTAYIVEMRKRFSSDLGDLRYIVYSYDKAKIFSVPLTDRIVVFSTEASANAENIVEKTLEYINTSGAKLSLYQPSNIINEDKKEMLRNLLESEISEEMIAEQLDLDMQTVRRLIQEMKK
jgi:hypothetical protein